jgi:deoxyribodipyrimidine photo-lyase
MHEFIPTRAAGLDRLASFLPKAGHSYTARRNADLPGHPHVSGLSPWLRHRLITEAEVIAAVRAAHPTGADKFLAEVWWRTYWKGWLELRPHIWGDYQSGLRAALNRVQSEGGLADRTEAAMTGSTGIDGFNHWALELTATGYLHNHARMWFASIWIFTLRLPWELGADFFLRHLRDGDAASNTLSWRWVAGLHTPGKTYLATTDNIARYTEGRFAPQGLARSAPPLPFVPHPAALAAPLGDRVDPSARTLLLITEDDLSPEFLLQSGLRPAGVAALMTIAGRSPLAVADPVHAFTTAAMTDCLHRLGAATAPVMDGDAPDTPDTIVQFATAQGITQIVTPYAPVGPAATAVAALRPVLEAAGIRLVRVLRDHDRASWPHATHGFFRFRDAVMQP